MIDTYAVYQQFYIYEEINMREHMHKTGYVFKILGWTICGIIFSIIIAFAFGYFVMLLWNMLMPALFGIIKINYWQGFGIILLARIIFGHGIHFNGGRSHDKWMKLRNHHSDNGKWNIKGGWKDWKYYDEYWQEEGKDAFEKYIDKRESEKGKEME
jgi:hypothetical protein